MGVKHDGRIEKFLDVDNICTREKIRMFVLANYAIEDCNVKTRYYIETFNNGKRLYFERPTRLNKGCDFVLFAEDVITFKNGHDKAPSHKDVLDDLAIKKSKLSQMQYAELLEAIKCIYETKPYIEAEKHVKNLPSAGWSYELFLKLLRWLFIEQDITYWAGEGRNMLYTAITTP